jgi:hypothetical protein
MWFIESRWQPHFDFVCGDYNCIFCNRLLYAIRNTENEIQFLIGLIDFISFTMLLFRLTVKSNC